MKKPSRPRTMVLIFMALALAVFVIDLALFGGAFRSIRPAFAGSCRPIALGGSGEDIRIDRKRGIAYLSLLDRDSLRRGEEVHGTVMLLDLNISDPAPRAAMTYDPEAFRPRGLSLLEAGSMPARLFVISQRADGSDTVEIAEEGPAGGFIPKETIRSDAFVSPMAIVATGPREFYVANDFTIKNPWAKRAAMLFRVGGSTLVYYDGSNARIEATDLRFVTGLALSPDGSRLYAAETLAKSLRVYRRATGSGALELEEIVDLGVAPGNLNVDDDGVVWIAAYPKLLSLAAHLRDPGKQVPTQVLRFDPKDKRLTEIYLDDGAAISAGSTAAPWRDEFLIGALFDRKVLLCKANP